MSSASKLVTLPASPSSGYYQGTDLMDAAEVAAWLKVTRSWVKEQTRQRAKIRCKNPLPHTKLGKYSRFSRRRIAEWLMENGS